MKYMQPEMEILRFDGGDILTESSELPILPLEEEEEESDF